MLFIHIVEVMVTEHLVVKSGVGARELSSGQLCQPISYRVVTRPRHVAMHRATIHSQSHIRTAHPMVVLGVSVMYACRSVTGIRVHK